MAISPPPSVPQPEAKTAGSGIQAQATSSSQALLWGTYLGGTSDDDGQAVAARRGGLRDRGGPHRVHEHPLAGRASTRPSTSRPTSMWPSSRRMGTQLLWGTYLGGSSWDYGWALALDADGNAVVGGGTYSSDIPTPGGYRQARRAARPCTWPRSPPPAPSSSGEPTSTAPSTRSATASALDAAGNVVFGGYTSSPTCPSPAATTRPTTAEQRTSTSASSPPTGHSLLWGTYLGGSGQDALTADRGVALALDAHGRVIVGTSTDSTATPIPTPGGFDTTKNGVLGYAGWGSSRPTGPSSSGGPSWAGPTTTSSSRWSWMPRRTWSSAAPPGPRTSPAPGGFDTTYNGGLDGYVGKLSSSGAQLLWGTYVGGTGDDSIRAVLSDGAGNVVLGGTTRSDDIPVPGGYDTSRNGWEDLYLAVLSPAGSQLLSGTFLGGNRAISARASPWTVGRAGGRWVHQLAGHPRAGRVRHLAERRTRLLPREALRLGHRRLPPDLLRNGPHQGGSKRPRVLRLQRHL